MPTNIWRYSGDGDWADLHIDGYRVEATDGHIGHVDKAYAQVETPEDHAHYIVVDTGVWVFGSRTMLPAGVIERVDPEHHKVFLSITKQQIKDAPEFDPYGAPDEAYRDKLGDHYDPGTINPDARG